MSQEIANYSDIEAALRTGEGIDLLAPEQVAADIVERILGADSVEEAFGGFDSTPADEIEGLTCTIHEVTWMQSTFSEGPPVYALMRVTIEGDGRTKIVSMGGRSVLAGLLWAQKNDALPLIGVFRRRATRDGSGNTYWVFDLAVTVVKA